MNPLTFGFRLQMKVIFYYNSADLRAKSASLSGGIMIANVVQCGGSPDFLFGRLPD